MKNRLMIWGIVLAILLPILLLGDVYKYIIVQLFTWCYTTADEICIGHNTIRLFVYFGSLTLSIYAISECIFYTREKRKRHRAFELKEYDSTPYSSSIAITNKFYQVIVNCSVQLVQVRVLNNQGCKIYFDEKRDVEKVPRFFLWGGESATRDLVKSIPEKIELAIVTKDEKIVLLSRKPIDYLPIFPDRKRNGLAKKATYHIEIKVCGGVNSNEKEVIVENTSFWEIGYRTDGEHYNSQNIWIKRISKLKDANNYDLGEPLPRNVTFNIVINTKDEI